MIPPGTAAYEKRGIAADLPKWDFTKCMQCNWCSYVCPHGVIRPFVLNDAEAEGVDGVLNMKGTKDKKFTIQSLLLTVPDADPVHRFARQERKLWR